MIVRYLSKIGVEIEVESVTSSRSLSAPNAQGYFPTIQLRCKGMLECTSGGEAMIGIEQHQTAQSIHLLISSALDQIFIFIFEFIDIFARPYATWTSRLCPFHNLKLTSKSTLVLKRILTRILII